MKSLCSPRSDDPVPTETRTGPLLDWLGARPVRVEGGRSRLELRVRGEHLRTLGIVHGGVVATLLDTALGMAAGSQAPEGHDVVTVQLNLHYIRPARQGETLIATAEVRHRGRRTAVAQGELRTDNGALVALASGTFMVLARAELTAPAPRPPGNPS